MTMLLVSLQNKKKPRLSVAVAFRWYFGYADQALPRMSYGTVSVFLVC